MGFNIKITNNSRHLNFSILHDLNAHYHIMSESDYKLAIEMTQ